MHLGAHVAQLRGPQGGGGCKSLPWSGDAHIQLGRAFRRRARHRQAQNVLQTKQVFQFHVAAQKKTITGSGYPPAGVHRRGGVHRQCDRPNPQVRFSGLLVLFLSLLCPRTTARLALCDIQGESRPPGQRNRAEGNLILSCIRQTGARWSPSRFRSIAADIRALRLWKTSENALIVALKRNSAFSNPLAVRSPGICFFACRSNRTTEVSGTFVGRKRQIVVGWLRAQDSAAAQAERAAAHRRFAQQVGKMCW